MDNIKQAIRALQQGKMVILTDARQREHEGDLIFPAETMTPDIVNFMIRHCTGIICLSLPPEKLQQLSSPLIVPPEQNTSHHQTPFTIPIDAKHGITTGVSATDRAHTIRLAAQENAKPDDFVRPGHIFTLQARPGGVLERPGHTEGALDLVRLAGFKSAAVLCEIMNPDGSMARAEALQAFAAHHQLPIVSIDELSLYRLQHENQIAEQTSVKIPLADYGEFTLTVIKEKYFPYEHIMLSKPPVNSTRPLLTRIHSACSTGDIFKSTLCDCHSQLHYALSRLQAEGGILFYLDQEGRGIGLFNKIKAYDLQNQGFDTLEANVKLGLPIDARRYYIVAQLLREQNISSIRLLTNNPQKIVGLKAFGFSCIEQETLPAFVSDHNHHYLKTKQTKLAHLINL